MEGFQVVAIGPLASSAVTVVGISTGVHVVASCPFEIWKADNVLQSRECAIGCVSQSVVDAIEESDELDLSNWMITYPVSGSLR